MEEEWTCNPTDTSWWPHREVGAPDDPYNQIPFLTRDDPLHDPYMEVSKEAIKLLHQEAYSDEGWLFDGEERDVEMYSKYMTKGEGDEQVEVMCFRGRGVCAVSPEIMRLQCIQLDLRKWWDRLFDGGRYICEVHRDDTMGVRVVHFKFQSPVWTVSGRDFVMLAGEQIMEDGTLTFFAKSITRDDVPETDEYVRGHVNISGFVVKPLPELTEDGRPQVELNYVAQVELNGWIPTFIADMVNQKQPLCVARIRLIADRTVAAIEALFRALLELEDWTASSIEQTLNDTVEPTRAKPEMVWEPVAYFLTGNRENVEGALSMMMERGKVSTLVLLWEALETYMKSNPNWYREGVKIYRELKSTLTTSS